PHLVREAIQAVLVTRRGGLGSIGQGAQVMTANRVLIQHPANGTVFAGEAVGLHHRKQLPFFLAVMAPVGKSLEEVDRLASGPQIAGAFGAALFRHFFQAARHLFDAAVLAHENIRRVHGSPSTEWVRLGRSRGASGPWFRSPTEPAARTGAGAGDRAPCSG